MENVEAPQSAQQQPVEAEVVAVEAAKAVDDSTAIEANGQADQPPVKDENNAAQELQAPAPAATDAEEVADSSALQNNGANEHAKDAAPMPSDEEIISHLQGLLKEVDLAVTTEKMLRRQLEAKFGVELGSKKALLRKEIETYLESQEGPEEGAEEEESEDEEEEEEAPKKRSRGGASRFGDVLSEPMSIFLGLERCPRTQVVKKMWEYIKANDLQDPKDRRKVLLDDKMKTIFPGKSVTMFTMQKHLSKHVFVDDTVDDVSEAEDSEEESRPKKAARKPAAAKKPAKSKSRGGATEGGPPKLNGFTKPVKLSPEMAAWMGTDAAPRPQITKKLWAYVKENNLQDPANKQFVLADETLKKLTGEERFQAFGFSKLIKQHVFGYAD